MARKTKYNKQYFDKNKFNTEDPWGFWTSEYELMKYRRQIDIVKKYHPKPKEILEIGCAEGAFTKMLRDNFSEANIIGVDISLNAIRRAKRNVRNAIFIRKDILKFIDNLPKDRFDVVIISEIIYYLGVKITFLEMYDFLEEIKNLLREKGILITANAVDQSNLTKRPIIESYYTLLSGLLILIEKEDYRNYKKEEGRKLNYTIRVFQKQ